MSARNEDLSQFSFAELLEMIRSISRTKHQSRQGLWREGYGLQSIDDLESHVDGILDEMARRIREDWTLARIEYNFRYARASLPNDILNFHSLNSSQLRSIIYKNTEAIGAERNEKGEEEIFFVFSGVKFKMCADGRICNG